MRISQCFLLVSRNFLTFTLKKNKQKKTPPLHKNHAAAWLCRLFIIFLSDVGLSDIPGEAMVKLYCPKCMDVYTPKSSRHHHTDGAYFGTGFPHMLFMVHPEYRPKRPANQFVPRFVWLDTLSFLALMLSSIKLHILPHYILMFFKSQNCL